MWVEPVAKQLDAVVAIGDLYRFDRFAAPAQLWEELQARFPDLLTPPEPAALAQDLVGRRWMVEPDSGRTTPLVVQGELMRRLASGRGRRSSAEALASRWSGRRLDGLPGSVGVWWRSPRRSASALTAAREAATRLLQRSATSSHHRCPAAQRSAPISPW